MTANVCSKSKVKNIIWMLLTGTVSVQDVQNPALWMDGCLQFSLYLMSEHRIILLCIFHGGNNYMQIYTIILAKHLQNESKKHTPLKGFLTEQSTSIMSTLQV